MSEPIDTAEHITAALQRIASLPTPQIAVREPFRPTEERKPLSRANGWEKRYIRAFDRPAGEWETTHARICTIRLPSTSRPWGFFSTRGRRWTPRAIPRSGL